MCAEAQIGIEGRRFSNHSGKMTCATRPYESGQFDEQTIMSRTGHRSTAIRSYKRANSSLMKSVSDALQPPKSDSPKESSSSKKTKSEEKKLKSLATEDTSETESKGTTTLVVEYGKTSLQFRFEQPFIEE